jgi:hypothetical protein
LGAPRAHALFNARLEMKFANVGYEWDDKEFAVIPRHLSAIERIKELEETVKVLKLFNEMVLHYGMDPRRVHQELSKIDEYKEATGDPMTVS